MPYYWRALSDIAHSAKDQCVPVLLGDAYLLGRILGSLHHGNGDAGVSAEVVHIPVLPLRLTSRAQGIRPYGVGPVGAAVAHQAKTHLVSTKF